jgi:putative toxin-antitoxin system antitoxin component (TIGR02293 family)
MPTQVLRKPKTLDQIVQREAMNAQKSLGSATHVLDELRAHGFNDEELYDLVVPRRTLMRRRGTGSGRLSLDESGRAFRLARIMAHAERAFGEAVKARRWLRKPSRTLNGLVPLALLKTEPGAHLVEQTLYQIEYGMLT